MPDYDEYDPQYDPTRPKPRLQDRIEADPETRRMPGFAGGMAGGAPGLPDTAQRLPDAARQYQAPPESRQHLAGLEEQYGRLSQPPTPLSLKQRILQAIPQAAVMIGAGIAQRRGEPYALADAARGWAQSLQEGETRQQQQQMARQQERGRLLTAIESERRTQEAERGAMMRAQLQEEGLTQRAQLAAQSQAGAEQRLSEQIAARQSIETQRETAAQDRMNAQFAQQAELQRNLFGQQQALLDKRLAALEDKQGEAKRQFNPAIAASVVQATTNQDTVRDLLRMLEPIKNQNVPFSEFTKTAAYRLGKAQYDEIGKRIAEIQLSSLVQAGTILKGMGGVRAFRAVELALQHTPQPLKDSPMLMYQKLQNIDRQMTVFLSDADQFGRKGSTEIPAERLRPYAPAPINPAQVRWD